MILVVPGVLRRYGLRGAGGVSLLYVLSQLPQAQGDALRDSQSGRDRWVNWLFSSFLFFFTSLSCTFSYSSMFNLPGSYCCCVLSLSVSSVYCVFIGSFFCSDWFQGLKNRCEMVFSGDDSLSNVVERAKLSFQLEMHSLSRSAIAFFAIIERPFARPRYYTNHVTFSDCIVSMLSMRTFHWFNVQPEQNVIHRWAITSANLISWVTLTCFNVLSVFQEWSEFRKSDASTASHILEKANCRPPQVSQLSSVNLSIVYLVCRFSLWLVNTSSG